jgi:alkanesulfonate monooxygenase SsuD/methylene tetrahydromethanopterin reductase-like flavin-dependent oxidoreductase (luciferase family)
MTDLKYGIFPDVRRGWEATRLTVQEAEKLGYESVWLAEHLMGDRPVLESWTTLSALSSLTTRIRLGTMVLCNSFRNPALLAKMAATLDNVSRGRLELGIGAGWKEDEYVGYGYDFPSPATRVHQLKDTLIILDKMWNKSSASYQGKHFRITQAYCEPKPIQKPRIPITVGGTGEQLMLKLVARYADRSNWWVGPKELFAGRTRILDEYCRRFRKRQQIEKSATALLNIAETQDQLARNLEQFHRGEESDKPFEEWRKEVTGRMISGTPDQCVEQLRIYTELGVTYFMIRPIDLPKTEGISLFAKEIKKRKI